MPAPPPLRSLHTTPPLPLPVLRPAGAIVVPEGGVAGVGTPIAFVAETEADLEAAKAKASGAVSKTKRWLESQAAPHLVWWCLVHAMVC